ncbi:hypothetical protein NW249_23650 [Streptomyces sp. OUCMDZ-4982]|uniref:hypothetical protein n=1 Tax=Streptomyces sp. OUCMDZ-4982 TaxID=2973090 RepID=UPI00215BB0FE|nr:hypothetical protein [Streptomyces sp. OUCMDZ-4982]MCR8945116.1 hypothetical protein [Streptomyces sp. OUCMDZ-4982]
MTDLAALVDELDRASSTWLDPRANDSATLRQLLPTAASLWPTAWDRTGPGDEVVLFPLLYTKRPQITTASFHHLIDAACEAERGGGRVLLVSVPTSRHGPDPKAGHTVRRIAQVFAAHGLPVSASGDVSELTGAAHLVARACTMGCTRRAVDVPDLLTAAAADALGATAVVLNHGLVPGRNLHTLPLIAPLSRLHDPGNPFAEPPPEAKKPPAGSDALWSSAFTLALTGAADPSQDRQAYVAALGRRTGPLWHQLRRDQLTGHYAAPAPNEPLRIRADDHPLGNPVNVPLFGAPAISDSTRLLVAAAALAGPVTLVIDDLTPRFSYRTYPAGEARARYQRLAADHGGQARFLTDLPDLHDRIENALGTLTHGALRTAAGPRSSRRRGALTGYDAVHLAVMGVCCTTGTDPGTTVAVKPANLGQLRVFSTLGPPARLLTCTGTGDIATGELHVPAHWITRTPGVHL